MKMFTMGQRLS